MTLRRVPELVLSNGFVDGNTSSDGLAHTFSTASLPSYASIMAELPRTGSEADILAHTREVGG